MATEFDETKDYYHALGVLPEATFEELKAAHIKMALQFHPDMAHSSSNKSISPEQRNEKFRNISEAWFVLSKFELRGQYDAARVRNGMMKATGSQQNTGGAIDIPTSFNTQRDSFAVALKHAGQDWKNNRDKYKCEKWHKLTLDQKKLSRFRRHGSLLGDSLIWGMVLGSGFAFYYISKQTLFAPDSTHKSLMRLRPKTKTP